MSSINKKIVQDYYQKLWNEKDKSYIEKLMSDNLFFRGSLNVEANGKKEFEDYMDMILNAIPDLFHGIEFLVAEDNKVAAKAIYNGTHKGKLFDFEGTGNRIKYSGATFFEFEDNKITKIWVLGDLNSLYKQLEN